MSLTSTTQQFHTILNFVVFAVLTIRPNPYLYLHVLYYSQLPLYKYRGFAFVTFSLVPGTVVRYGGTCSLIFVEESPECKLVKCMMMGRVPRLRSTFGNLRHAFTFTTLRALRLDRVKVRGILRVEDLWNIVSWCSADHQPVNSMEERMVLDVIHTAIT